jgi:hypothetical protein
MTEKRFVVLLDAKFRSFKHKSLLLLPLGSHLSIRLLYLEVYLQEVIVVTFLFCC